MPSRGRSNARRAGPRGPGRRGPGGRPAPAPAPAPAAARAARATRGGAREAAGAVSEAAEGAEGALRAEHTYRLGAEDELRVAVSEENGDSRVLLSTSRGGDLVLHWGVEGCLGPAETAGWGLPDRKVWPSGTVVYKNRALQSPWIPTGRGNELLIAFDSDEKVAALDFVVKDASGDRWFDFNGTNFRVPLDLSDACEVEFADVAPGGGPLPEIPQKLAGIWAYVKWELAGCPERSQDAADQEFKAGLQEMKQFLRAGTPLEELWTVARGGRAGGSAPASRRGPRSSPTGPTSCIRGSTSPTTGCATTRAALCPAWRYRPPLAATGRPRPRPGRWSSARSTWPSRASATPGGSKATECGRGWPRRSSGGGSGRAAGGARAWWSTSPE